MATSTLTETPSQTLPAPKLPPQPVVPGRDVHVLEGVGAQCNTVQYAVAFVFSVLWDRWGPGY